MKKIVKWIIILVVAIAAIGGGVYSKNQPIVLETKKVEPTTATLDFTEQGIVVAQRVAEVYSLTSGKIVNLLVKEGQQIKVGDIICELDKTSFELELKQVEMNTESIKAQRDNLRVEEQRRRDTLVSSKNNLASELKTLESQQSGANQSKEEQLQLKDEQVRLQNIVIAQSETDLARAIENLDKVETLWKSGGLPKKDYDDAVKAVSLAETALEQNKQQIEVIKNTADVVNTEQYEAMKQAIETQIDGINDDLNKNYSEAMYKYYTALMDANEISSLKLKDQMDYCSVSSPVSGTITTLYIKDTNVVTQQTPVASITTEGENNIEVFVSTKDVDVIKEGNKVELSLERRLNDVASTGTVKGLDDKATIKVSALGVEERRVKVTITPDDPKEFKEGYDVDVKFNYYREENKITVPKTATFKENDVDMVWVIKDGAAAKVQVTKGAELRSDTVVEGINAGDIVVTDSSSALLKEGVKVKVE